MPIPTLLIYVQKKYLGWWIRCDWVYQQGPVKEEDLARVCEGGCREDMVERVGGADVREWVWLARAVKRRVAARKNSKETKHTISYEHHMTTRECRFSMSSCGAMPTTVAARNEQEADDEYALHTLEPRESNTKMRRANELLFPIPKNSFRIDLRPDASKREGTQKYISYTSHSRTSR